MKIYNIGEWAELYAFAKIISDGHLSLCDRDLKPSKRSLQVDGVTRAEGFYCMSISNSVEMNTSDEYGETLIRKSELDKIISEFIDEASSKKSKRMSLVSGETLISRLKLKKVKPSSGKSDIILSIVDPTIAISNKVGFSIKSYVGAPPTLLNFGKQTTRFVFDVDGFYGEVDLINQIDSKKKIKDRVSQIIEHGGIFKFNKVKHNTFEKNLLKIDSLLPQILAEIILAFVSVSGKTKIKDLVNISLSKINEFATFRVDEEIITYKMKNLLLNVALGMVPATPWDGILTADGGYVIVKPSWDLVCFHVFNIGEFSNYLFENIKLDSPSTSEKKGDYAYLYKDKDGRLKFDLQLQLRFIDITSVGTAS